MILQYLVLWIPLVACQYLPQGMQPDVAFGDHNDRFDLGGLFEDQVNQNEEDFRRQKSIRRRSGVPYRRDDYDWENDVGVPDMFVRAHDLPRRRHSFNLRDLIGRQQNVPKSTPPPPQQLGPAQEMVVHYPLPIKMEFLETANRTFITGLKII